MLRHAPEFSDTHPQVLRVRLEMLRRKTPAERLAMALDMSDFALRLSAAGVRARFPAASEREVFLRSAALRLLRDLMIRAFGWDPDEHAG